MWRVSTVLALNGLSTPYSFSDAARDRGTAVHAFNEAIAFGWTGQAVDDDDPYAAQKRALVRWYEQFQPKVLVVEKRITSKEHRLTGRIDLGIVWKDAAIIVDLKTGAEASSHGIQVCGYVDLANNDQGMHDVVFKHVIGPWDRAILYLKDNGTYHWRGPMTLLKAGPQDAFLWRSAHALTCWKYDNNLLSVIDSEHPDDDPATLSR